MRIHLGVARPIRRALWSALLATACAAGPSAAWEYPLLPHVHGLAFFPETPTSEYHTSALLSAVYPNECWRLVDTLFVDSAHVRVTVQRATDCGDSVSTWTHGFDLGFLAAGMHELTVHCTVRDGNLPPAEEEITVPFEVVPAGPPPPPPPPPGNPLLEQIQVTGAEPNHPVTLTLNGFKPFECTWIHDERVVNQGQVEATFDWQSTCADTSRRWTRSFDLGVFPLGYHEVLIKLGLRADDTISYVYDVARFRVADPNEPPPVDSVTVTVTSIRTEPVAPKPNDPVTLYVRGTYPSYFCGRFVQDGRWDDRIEFVMEPVRTCDDTARTWEHSFALGPLAAGNHAFQLTTIWRLIGTAGYRYWPFSVQVNDSGPPPPPPPPPDDSLHATLSVSTPNPFRDFTQFAVSLADPTEAVVSVFDLQGRFVATIHRGMLPRGTSTLSWNGRRQNGARATQGIYFYQLVLPGRVVHRRVVLLDAP